MSNLDSKCQQIIENNINMTVPWYLMASYSYYELDRPILSDGMFDNMAKVMLANWSKIKHWHKNLITVDDLKAGTLMLKEYPLRVQYSTKTLLKDNRIKGLGVRW